LDKGAPDLGKVPADYSKALGDAAEAERISLSPHEREAMDWIVRDLISPEPRTLTELARNMGISRGYASKLAKRVIKRLRDRLK
jgi:DNA-directed RNA polymerase specialized sigma subunit